MTHAGVGGHGDQPHESAPSSLSERLAAWLGDESGQSWSVIVTTNQTRLASVRRSPRKWTLRVVEPLLDPAAWPDVLAYLRGNDRAAVTRLRTRVEAHEPLVPMRWRPSPRCAVHHSLPQLVAQVVERHFPHGTPAPVSWAVGQRSMATSAKNLELGCFVAHTRRVLIDPCLDQANVPSVYLRFVIYHELLHANFEAQGHLAHRHHDPSFRAAEAQFDDFAQARHWERVMLPTWRPSP